MSNRMRAFVSKRCSVRARNLLPSVLGFVALLVGSQAFAIGEDEYLNPEDAF